LGSKPVFNSVPWKLYSRRTHNKTLFTSYSRNKQHQNRWIVESDRW
jgi:hypothetical protein